MTTLALPVTQQNPTVSNSQENNLKYTPLHIPHRSNFLFHPKTPPVHHQKRSRKKCHVNNPTWKLSSKFKKRNHRFHGPTPPFSYYVEFKLAWWLEWSGNVTGNFLGITMDMLDWEKDILFVCTDSSGFLMTMGTFFLENEVVLWEWTMGNCWMCNEEYHDDEVVEVGMVSVWGCS